MSSSLIIKTLVLLVVTAHVRSQYIEEFFQRFSSIIQPYQTTRRNDLVTKRPTNKQASRQGYQDTIFFETDDFLKEKESGLTDPFTTTVKPRRKKIKTTAKPSTRNPWYQESTERNTERNNNIYYERTTNIYNNQAIIYDDRQTERPAVFNNNFNVAQKPINSRPIFSSHTTVNPLLNRPGVMPAVVDDGRPPITNKPVPYTTQRPVLSNRPNAGNEGVEPAVDTGRDEDDMSETEIRRYIEISEQKCDEYKSLNTKKVVALPLATLHASQGVELNVSSCSPVNIPLIIGGKVVSIQEFPHMSLVGWKNIQNVGYTWKCGGSLISEQFILTAGHCTYYDKDYNVVSGPPAAVQLGSSIMDGQDSLVVRVASVIRHPKYKLRRSYYDVALIKLVTTVTFSETISPACLGVPPPVGDRVIATGWGRTEFGGESSQELRSVSVPIWDMGECREIWGTSRKLPEGPSPASQLCAGERGGGRDTCQGDSGGPAQIQDGCSWRVVAVTSVGRSCGAADTPALYAKIPRAFIASLVFSNVKLSNNRNNNDNRYNGNNNGNIHGNNNWDVSANGFNNQGVASTQNFGNSRPGNHQTIGNNNWGVTSNNNFANSQSSGSNRDAVSRPGNHQTIGGVVSNINQFGNSQSSATREKIVYGSQQVENNNNRREISGSNKFGNNQNSGNTRDEITRPGNHQTIDYNNRDSNAGNNYFVTSHTSGNSGDETISRPGNHQAIAYNNRDTATGNYFVTSHTSGNNRDTVVSRPGNHQTVENNNRDTDANNYFMTSQTSGNDRGTDISRPGNHQTVGNNRFSDSQNSESNQDTVFDSSENHQINDNNKNHYNNQQSTYDNNYRNPISRTPEIYSSFGSQSSDYGTTYNRNNNGYNGNNNGYIVAKRPW